MLHSYCIHVHELTNMFGICWCVWPTDIQCTPVVKWSRVSKFIVHLDEAISFFAF